ncbi:dTDP-4-amino-4,6-dideoxygalactose transaminase, partial [Salmonella enterica subsp. enterica serovar Typhi]|nr:dTDP-4-amino-4,6-dideoxygalactose transaminase [Salmonella enterica subsp. enterica serovar Typhi]
MIPFNVPCVTGFEIEKILDAINNRQLSGDGFFTKRCSEWFEKKFGVPKVLLTTSCTHALEIAALLADIQPGDEVIMSSYTFVSTANAFVLRGAKIIFVDIRPDTMNIDESLIEAAITPKTKVIVPVHYAGVSCDMDYIMMLADKYNLLVVEDAAQAVMSKYKNRYLGTIGHIGCYSFHETKNFNCGEGGAILLNDHKLIERAEIIREKGTNRSRFLKGQLDKYTWVDVGSSYLPSELNAAFLYGQLEQADEINNNRRVIWDQYFQCLKPLADKKMIDIPVIPDECVHNAHMFYVKARNLAERTELIEYLKN